MTELELKCTGYMYIDDDMPSTPCHCPVCGGFLKWEDEVPICTKCGTDLISIPDRDEETNEVLEWGKICPISLPKKLGVKAR